jgi:hypothetical protein
LGDEDDEESRADEVDELEESVSGDQQPGPDGANRVKKIKLVLNNNGQGSKVKVGGKTGSSKKRSVLGPAVVLCCRVLRASSPSFGFCEAVSWCREWILDWGPLPVVNRRDLGLRFKGSFPTLSVNGDNFGVRKRKGVVG